MLPRRVLYTLRLVVFFFHHRLCRSGSMVDGRWSMVDGHFESWNITWTESCFFMACLKLIKS
jgi:hypothetical protein